MSQDPDRAVALAALYQAERQDLTGILTQSIALVSVTLTYMAVIAALVSSGNFKLGPVIIGWLGLPVWMLIAFHSLILALIFAHGQSVRILEFRLIDLAGISNYRGAIGAAAGTAVTDIDILLRNPRRWGLAGSTVVAYGGFFGIAVAFTAYALVRSWTGQTTCGGYAGGFWCPLGVYLLCAVLELFAIIYIFKFMHKDLLDNQVSDVVIP
ncbi:hypothetical protein [Mycolicibacterium llatzerense]|uniref:hypothetical protein n=1 Tax=Mycolicibacterium llatzerense TaxID=280871 RepID=UPI0013A6AF6C|nr:hypothetical protein [Mycolicibacterium llatzerense]